MLKSLTVGEAGTVVDAIEAFAAGRDTCPPVSALAWIRADDDRDGARHALIDAVARAESVGEVEAERMLDRWTTEDPLALASSLSRLLP